MNDIIVNAFLILLLLPPLQKNKRKLSERPATVARRKRLEKLEIKVGDEIWQ